MKLISGVAYIRMYFFGSQIDAPITQEGVWLKSGSSTVVRKRLPGISTQKKVSALFLYAHIISSLKTIVFNFL